LIAAPPPVLFELPNSIDSPEPGIYYGVPMEVYRSWNAINHTYLNGFHQSAAKGVHEINNPKGSEVFDFGIAAHTRLLEPDLYTYQYVTVPTEEGPINGTTGNWYKPGSKKYDEWHAKYLASLDDEQRIISIGDAERIEGMIESIKANKSAAGFATHAYPKREMSVVWDEVIMVSGQDRTIRCKARIDLFIDRLGKPINKPAMLDFKTTRSAYYDNFLRDMTKYGYYRQVGWYLRGLFMSGMVTEMHNWVGMILAVESQPPYQSAIYYLNLDTITQGLYEHKQHLLAFARWAVTGEAPGLPHWPRPMQLSAWDQLPMNEVISTTITGERI